VWVETAWQHISPEVTVKGCKKYCIRNVVDGTDDDMIWNVRSECEGKMKVLTVKMETVALIGKGR